MDVFSYFHLQRNERRIIMSGFFGTVSKNDSVFELFYGTDYHSHLGTRRAGLVVYDPETGFEKSIHNIENAPFRTKFTSEATSMHGTMGIGCISDYEPQPLLIRSHHGTYALTTVGKINNAEEIASKFISDKVHFFETQNGDLNPTELTAAIINQKENLIEGIRYAQEIVDGSLSILVLNEKGIYAARDKFGRTPIVIGKKAKGYCVSFESFAYLNLGYKDHKELGPGEIVIISPDDGVKTLLAPGTDMKICAFLWVYYGYPASSYEGISVEKMRYNCGRHLAQRDKGSVEPDIVAGVPDSGLAHAIGYANESGVQYARPFVKYTPTWPRSFMPSHQNKRNLIAKMKLIPIHDLIDGKKLLLIDDSIVRGTQLRETTDFLYESGAKEVHIRLGCPPIMFGCKYLNFSRSNSDMDLITRRTIYDLEGGIPTPERLELYLDPETEEYARMIDKIREEMHFTSLRYSRLDDMIDATGLPADKLCTYCWNGKD